MEIYLKLFMQEHASSHYPHTCSPRDQATTRKSNQ